MHTKSFNVVLYIVQNDPMDIKLDGAFRVGKMFEGRKIGRLMAMNYRKKIIFCSATYTQERHTLSLTQKKRKRNKIIYRLEQSKL